MSRPHIYSQEFKEIERMLVKNDFPKINAKKIFSQLYRYGNFDFESNQYLSKDLCQYLMQNYSYSNFKIVDIKKSTDDQTIKLLIKLEDQKLIETVLVPFGKRYTICLSTQVGCAMKCNFCYTATQGLQRNLMVHEIVQQYMVAWKYLKENIDQKSILPQIVFMGQGEPLHNFENVKKSIHIFLCKWGLYLGPRNITLSTVGHLPGLLRFNELGEINLAISLHSAVDEIRSNLIPLNRLYPIKEIFKAVSKIKFKSRQFINCEYLMIENLNDTLECANELVDLLKNKNAIVNIIAFNPFPGTKYKRPSTEKLLRFKSILMQSNIFTKMRTTKGDDILAACGQLKISHEQVAAAMAENNDLKNTQIDLKP